MAVPDLSRDSTFTLASFNIQRALAPDGRTSLRGLRHSCAALHADILGLQEVDRFRRRSGFAHQSARIARQLGCAHAFGPVRHRITAAGYGNAVLTTGSLADVEVRVLPGTGRRQPRAILLCRVRLEGMELSVGVTHLQHYPQHLHHLPDEAPEQLEAAAGWLAARPGPRVLLGDLNLQPPRAEPILTAAGFTIAPTGPAHPADAPRVWVDYIAVDGLEVVAAGVAPRAEVSDHRAVFADVRGTCV
jgi:endonuclease/exonuclease/phosphatase family metal-dependent hydrolase